MGIYTEAVQKLYVAYFSRPADAAGLAYWENVVTAAKGNTAAVSAAFAASQEYKDTFAGQSAYQVINTIYQNLFGRPAEAAALTFWGQGLLNKNFTIDNAVTAIASGAQGTDLVAYNSKVAAATAFSAALDTSAEMIGYNGTAANNAAKTWLAGITTDASLKAAIEPAALNVTVSAVTNPPVIGGTFTLTAGVDTIVGTSANDTINALSVSPNGTAGDTLTAFDAIDGGAGTDTLNVYTTGTENEALLSSTVITNVETINVYNTGAAAALADASKYTGVTQLWQIGAAAAGVTGLASTTTAGFDGTTSAISVAGNASAATVNVALKGVSEESAVTITGAKLAGFNLTGTVVDGPTDANTTAGSLAVGATAGTDVTTFTINSAVAATVTVANGNKTVTTVDASASAGAITHAAAVGVTTLRGGAGADTLSIQAATVAATETAAGTSATVEGGAGKDSITVATTGTGATTVDAGAGDDTVAITTRGSGKLTVNLGDGADTFTSAVAVAAGDVIDAGAGMDTLALNLVGSANIGAFSNFDSFDAKGLNRTLDVDILSSKNTVTEFVASGDVGAATLTNVGAGVGVRITKDMAGSTLVLNQKAAGALTVTVDADEAGTGNDTGETVAGAITTNATSVKAVFDSAYVADRTAEKTLGMTADNYTVLTVNAADATSLEVTSGGTNSVNEINTTGAKLASITVTGAQTVVIGTVDTTKLTSIDASAATGGMIVATNDVANAGVIKLGTGVDVVTVTTGSVAAGAEQVSGFEKAAAAAVGTDATAAAAAQADADTLVFTGGTVANANAGVTTGTISKGVLTFTGAGPADLAAAFAIADAAAETTGEVVVFEYLGNSYVFQQGTLAGDATGDLAVKLVGITGITQLGEVGTTDGFFLV